MLFGQLAGHVHELEAAQVVSLGLKALDDLQRNIPEHIKPTGQTTSSRAWASEVQRPAGMGVDMREELAKGQPRQVAPLHLGSA